MKDTPKYQPQKIFGGAFWGSGGKKDNTLLYGILILLAIGFFVLVGFVFFFSDSLLLSADKCVGVVEISGDITTQSIPASLFSEGIPSSEDIAKGIEGIEKRDDITAIVFVIDSPGGSVVGTREIYNAMKELKKPKVSYLREVAASGGYYIAAATEYIVADPNTITGSIGVVATSADMSGLLEKIGINTTNIVSGKHKDIGAPNRPMDSEEYEIIKNIINETFQEFKSVVIEGRKGRLIMEKFEAILDGRILSGRQAKEIGLIDELGSKKDAINKAAGLGNIDAGAGEPRICKIKIVPESSSGSLFGIEAAITKIMKMNSKGKMSITFE